MFHRHGRFFPSGSKIWRCTRALIGRSGEGCAPADLLRRDPSARGIVRGVVGAIMVAGLVVAGGQGSAGHSVGHFPSYYPHEIRIEAIEPAAAAKGLSDETLHAYVGAAPDFRRASAEARGVGAVARIDFWFSPSRRPPRASLPPTPVALPRADSWRRCATKKRAASSSIPIL